MAISKMQQMLDGRAWRVIQGFKLYLVYGNNGVDKVEFELGSGDIVMGSQRIYGGTWCLKSEFGEWVSV